jgi:hypothetical protein
MEISSIRSRDLVDGREYYAFRLSLNNNYRLSVPLEDTQPQRVIARLIDNGPNYRLYKADENGQITEESLCHSWYIKDPDNGITWKNTYDWWLCDTYENAVFLRDVLINKIMDNLRLKMKFLTALKEK